MTKGIYRHHENQGFQKGNKTHSQFKKGHTKIGGFMKGDKHTKNAKIKIAESVRGKLAEKSRNWKGGKTEIRLLIPSLEKYKIWRESVFKRDNYTCQNCRDNKGHNLEAHHKISLSKLIDKFKIKTSQDAIKCSKLWDMNNGKTLCKNCHKLTDNYGGAGNAK